MEVKWDEFLTERDKAVLAVSRRGAKGRFGLGDRPAVLVVDDYYQALGIPREPILESVRTWPSSCGAEGWEAIDRTVELLNAARAVSVPVVYLHGLDDFPSPWGSRKKSQRLAHLPHELRAKANEIVEEIAPQAGDLVIQKASPSAYAGTPLQFHLTYLGINTVIVCGESTSGCVRATVVDAATHRYQVGVVHDCCFDRTEASHWINLFDMDQKYADVMDLADTRRYFESLSAGQTLISEEPAVSAEKVPVPTPA